MKGIGKKMRQGETNTRESLDIGANFCTMRAGMTQLSMKPDAFCSVEATHNRLSESVAGKKRVTCKQSLGSFTQGAVELSSGGHPRPF